MVNHKRYIFVACALLFFAAQQSFAQRFMRTKTAPVHNYVDISSEDALRNAIKKYPIIVIKAYSPTCPHCIQYEGAFNAVAQSLKDKAYFVAYNANNKEFDDFSDEYKVNSLPTTLIFVNGVLKTNRIGGMSQDALATEINKVSVAKKEMPSKPIIEDLDEDDALGDIDIEEEDIVVIKQAPAPKPVAKRAPVKKEVVIKKEERKPSCCQKPAKPVCAKPQQKPQPQQQKSETKPAHGGLKHIATQAEYDVLMGDPEKLVVVKFYGIWCGPCKEMAPRFEKLAEKYADKALFVEIDVDKTDEDLHALVEKVQSLPHIMFIKGGQKVDSLGNAPDYVIESVIQKHTK